MCGTTIKQYINLVYNINITACRLNFGYMLHNTHCAGANCAAFRRI